MSLLDVLMAAEAAADGRAVRKTAYRHVHLEPDPLVIVAFNLSGEAAAPLGIMWGTSPKARKAHLAVAAEPRNRESRFGAINAFAKDLGEFLAPCLELETIETKAGGYRQVAERTPQIVVPNRATRSFLGARLGRSLRYLGLGDTHEVPDETQWAGAHLSWLGEHAQLPGQSVFVSATEALARHFATGQSGLEDESLAALLAWIDGVDGDLLPALEDAEQRAYGPVPNPKWEAKLEPFVKAYSVALREEDDAAAGKAFGHVEKRVREALAEAYEATHRGIDVLRSIAPAASVRNRWAADHRDWSSHAWRCSKGIPRFARRHDALRAAATLQRWTSAADALAVDEAFDDPLVMAHFDADGRCVTGTISDLDLDNKEVKPGNVKRTVVPLVELTLTAPTRLLKDEVVRWVGDRKVEGYVRSVDGDRYTIAVTGGMKSLGEAGFESLDSASFVGLDVWGGLDPLGPDEVPWTHREPPAADGDEVDADTSAIDDGSPDLPVAELADLPIVGAVAPGAEPAVVL